MLDPEFTANYRLVDRIAKMPLLASAARAWQPVVQQALSACGRGVQDALHGTFLGHPLHPMITDVPVGAWTVTCVLDALDACGVDDAQPGADAALAIGTVAAVGAAITGFTDWSDTQEDSRTLGMADDQVHFIQTYGSEVLPRLRRKYGARAPRARIA